MSKTGTLQFEPSQNLAHTNIKPTPGRFNVTTAARDLLSIVIMAQAQRHFSKILRLTNLRATVNKAGTEARVSIPGFTTDDFDRTGNLSIWRLQRLLTTARFYVYHAPNSESGKSFLQYDELTKDKYTFMASTHTHVDRSFYSLPDLTAQPSLAIKIHLGHVGRASLNSVAELVDSDSGFVFASNTNQVVVVDKATRKPSVLPDWWKDQYQGHIVGGEKLVVEPIKVPEESSAYHEYSMKVSWNDIDSYKHTNYVSYVRFCFDAAMDALTKGFFTQLKGDILLYPTKNMDILFKGESVAGQGLLVKVWENSEDPFKVHFDISRDEQSIFQNTMTFFQPQASL